MKHYSYDESKIHNKKISELLGGVYCCVVIFLITWGILIGF